MYFNPSLMVEVQHSLVYLIETKCLRDIGGCCPCAVWYRFGTNNITCIFRSATVKPNIYQLLPLFVIGVRGLKLDVNGFRKTELRTLSEFIGLVLFLNRFSAIVLVKVSFIIRKNSPCWIALPLDTTVHTPSIVVHEIVNNTPLHKWNCVNLTIGNIRWKIESLESWIFYPKQWSCFYIV